jgi:hypothetical protein
MNPTRITCSAAAVLLLTACGTAGTDDPQHDADRRATLPERSATRQDTLLIEGMPEPTTSQLVRSPDRFGVPFSTYVPDGIETSFEEGGDSAGVRFSAAFAGVREPNAYMHVRLYVPGAIPDPAEVAASFLRTRRPQDHPVDGSQVDPPHEQVDAPSWGDTAFAFRYAGEGGRMYMGRIVLARHDARQFHVLTHYPAEYGDGLEPRFARILDTWRWEDTGEMLTGGAAGDAGPARPAVAR